MNEISQYQQKLLQAIQKVSKSITLMEVCGTHTMAIAKSGIRELLPENITLLSGPDVRFV
jgi:hydrogenase expression/formation protein HypD